MTILIIEDEEPTARKLQRLLTNVMPSAEVTGMTVSVEESVDWLQTNPRPDLIFMDIELADGQSFDIFSRTTVTSPVIFTTAYDEYAIKAFKVNSIDYLLKPVKESDLRQALAKLQQLRDVLSDSISPAEGSKPDAPLANLLQQLQQAIPVQRTPLPASPTFRDRFLIKQGQRLFTVHIDEVAYFFSRRKLSFLKTHSGHEWLVDYTMDELSQMLDPGRFFRLNRQIIADVRAIDKVYLYFNGKLKIQLQPTFEEEVIVSRDKAGELKNWLGE